MLRNAAGQLRRILNSKKDISIHIEINTYMYIHSFVTVILSLHIGGAELRYLEGRTRFINDNSEGFTWMLVLMVQLRWKFDFCELMLCMCKRG